VRDFLILGYHTDELQGSKRKYWGFPPEIFLSRNIFFGWLHHPKSKKITPGRRVYLRFSMSSHTPSNIFNSPSAAKKKKKKKKSDGSSSHQMMSSLEDATTGQRPSQSSTSAGSLLPQRRSGQIPSQSTTNVTTQQLTQRPSISPVPLLASTGVPQQPRSLSPVLPAQQSSLTPLVTETLRSLSRTTSSNNISQSHSLEQLQQGDDVDFLAEDLLGDYDDDEPQVETGDGGNNGSSGVPSDWSDVSPNHIMARLKLLKQEVLEQHNLRPFYKSYSNWEKMTGEQRNKSVAWFRKLPEPLKGKFSDVLYFLFLVFFLKPIKICFFVLSCHFAKC
jgi:hypothetical protein